MGNAAAQTLLALRNLSGSSAAFSAEKIRGADAVFGAYPVAPAFPVPRSGTLVDYGLNGVDVGNGPATVKGGPVILASVGGNAAKSGTVSAKATAYVRHLLEQAVLATPGGANPILDKATVDIAISKFTAVDIEDIAKAHPNAWEFIQAWKAGKWQNGGVANLDGGNTVPAWVYVVDKDKLAQIMATQSEGTANGVGQPGFWEGLIPIWGSGRAAIDDFQNGRYFWGTVNTAFAVTDIFLVKSLVVGGVKLIGKTGAKLLPKLVGRDAASATARDVSETAGKWVLEILNNTCFAAGTPLLTPRGEKAIEDFRKGDEILCRPDDSPDACIRTSVVEEVFELSAPTLELRVGGRTIRTTAEHPFFVAGRGWVSAGELQVGDLLAGHDARATAVQSVTPTNRQETVYNLRVAIDHTYFVGRRDWGFSIWVHNRYYAQKIGNTWTIFEKVGNKTRIVKEGLSEDVAVRAAREFNRLVEEAAKAEAARLAAKEAANALHHSLPKFLGGEISQVIGKKIPAAIHREFHSLLKKALKARGIPLPIGGVDGSAPRWARYFLENEGAQQKAFEAVLEVSRLIDKKYGTSITQDVWKNIMGKNYRVLEP